MKEAMAQVKDELGDDAVILHTKKIKKGGILGYGAKEIFEVTAALDEVTRRPPKKRAERLPTLAELQAEEAGGGQKPKSSVPLPQGHASPMPAAPSAPPVRQTPEQRTAVPLPASRPAAAAPQSLQPASLPPQQRLSQSAARSYRTAGTEAAVAAAERQAYAPAPASSAAVSAESFVPSFPQGNAQEDSFQPLVPSAGEAPPKSPARKARRRKPAAPKRRKACAAEAKGAAGEETARAACAPRRAARAGGPAGGAAAGHEPASAAPASRRATRVADEAAVSPQEKRQKAEAPPAKSEEERQRETIEELQSELAQMKAMLVQVVSKEKTPEDEMSLQQALKQQEVEPDIIDDVVLQLPAEAILADKDTPLALEGLTKYLTDNVQMADGLELKSRKRKIAALLGPTGVGKTTTLAKIAAQCVLEKGVSTAFITADTYRISAVEQLKTYADILGLPIAIVYTPDELKEAIQKFRQKQLILIDTAGRSQHNRRQMAELKEFLAVNQNIEKYLVLSATTKNEDAKDILDKFSGCKPDKVIFTKTDETKSLGIILNILRRKEMRLSYLTNGQSVPDDIVPAEAGKLAKLFLR